MSFDSDKKINWIYPSVIALVVVLSLFGIYNERNKRDDYFQEGYVYAFEELSKNLTDAAVETNGVFFLNPGVGPSICYVKDSPVYNNLVQDLVYCGIIE